MESFRTWLERVEVDPYYMDQIVDYVVQDISELFDKAADNKLPLEDWISKSRSSKGWRGTQAGKLLLFTKTIKIEYGEREFILLLKVISRTDRESLFIYMDPRYIEDLNTIVLQFKIPNITNHNLYTDNLEGFLEQARSLILSSLPHELAHYEQKRVGKIREPRYDSTMDKEKSRDLWLRDYQEIEAEIARYASIFHSRPKKERERIIREGLRSFIQSLPKPRPLLRKAESSKEFQKYLLKVFYRMGIPFRGWEWSVPQEVSPEGFDL